MLERNGFMPLLATVVAAVKRGEDKVLPVVADQFRDFDPRGGSEFASLTPSELARECLERRGGRTRSEPRAHGRRGPGTCR